MRPEDSTRLTVTDPDSGEKERDREPAPLRQEIHIPLETYFIVPKVYGKSLRLSTLTVLLGLLVGSLLAGLPGARAALPLVASYAVIERIWLKHYLGEGVADKHEMQKDKEFGEKH